jgi:hypothetical protein
MPAAELVHQIGFVLRYVLLISVISVLIADVVAGRGLPNVFRRALLDRLPAEAEGINSMAKILMMAGSTVVVLSLLGFLVLLLKGRAVTKTSPVLMSLKALGIRPSEAEQRLCRQRVWVGNDTDDATGTTFFPGIAEAYQPKRWLLCPQVRVADIATLSPHIRPRSRTWWQLFRMASQWHCDVVIVDIHTFAIVGAVELDDASHLKKHRIRRDILLEEVLRQAGIPLLRDRDSETGQESQ